MRVRRLSRRRRTRMIMQFTGLALTLALLVGAAYTFAYFHENNTYVNAFKTADYSVNLKEDFTPINNWAPGISKDKKVWVENNGSTDAFVRIKYQESWSDNLPLTIGGNETVLKSWTQNWGTEWTKIGSWWYYNKVLKAGTQTNRILDAITMNPLVSNDSHAADYGRAEYTLTFQEEDLQSAADTGTEWGVAATVDGTGNVIWTP